MAVRIGREVGLSSGKRLRRRLVATSAVVVVCVFVERQGLASWSFCAAKGRDGRLSSSCALSGERLCRRVDVDG